MQAWSGIKLLVCAQRHTYNWRDLQSKLDIINFYRQWCTTGFVQPVGLKMKLLLSELFDYYQILKDHQTLARFM